MKARIHNQRYWVHIGSGEMHRKNIARMLRESDFSILKCIDHRFKPQGYTCIWLLGESHCALHTFPEENKTYLEISSCVYKPFKKFCVLFTKYCSSNKIGLKLV